MRTSSKLLLFAVIAIFIAAGIDASAQKGGKNAGKNPGKTGAHKMVCPGGNCDSACCGMGMRGPGMNMDRCPEFVDANGDGKCDVCVAKMDSLKAAGWTKEDFKREMRKRMPPPGFPDSAMRRHMKHMRDSLKAEGWDREDFRREFDKMGFPKFNDSSMRAHRERMKNLIDSLTAAGWDLGELRKDFERMKPGQCNDSSMRAHRERMKALMDSLRAAGVDLRGMFMPPHPGFGPDSCMGMRFMGRGPRFCRCAWLHHIGEENAPPIPNAEPKTNLGFELENPYPVPTGEKLNINLRLESSAQGNVELYDSNGKLVRSIFNGELTRGENKLYTDTRGLEAGTYILKATVAGQTTSKNVVINK